MDCIFIDVRPELTGHNDPNDTNNYWFDSLGIHPNQQGADVLANKVWGPDAEVLHRAIVRHPADCLLSRHALTAKWAVELEVVNRRCAFNGTAASSASAKWEHK